MCGGGGDVGGGEADPIPNDKEPDTARVARDRQAGKTRTPKTVLTGPRGLDADLYGKALLGE
ncbi:MAG: hypothetical protein AAF661_04965 [Pseudomonadota bacterium]